MTSTDRRALVRAYKETPRPMGVFRIRHIASGRSLIGTSVDLPSILNRHRVQLRLDGHRNEALQREWNALGEEAFAFETLDVLTPREEPGYDPTDDLAALEAMWLEQLKPFAPDGYTPQRRR